MPAKKIIKKKVVKKVVKKKSPTKPVKKEPKKKKEKPVKTPYKYAEYLIFIDWTATPRIDRNPETQTEFAKEYKINPDTLVEWKKRVEFWDEVRACRNRDLLDRTGDILRSIEKEGLRGDMRACKLFLQYTDQLVDKKDIDHGASPELIEALERMRKVLPD